MSLHDEPFDPAKPALIVTVGNTARKHRHLGRDVMVLGRAHGCDIGLTAPDVSSIHCLIYRGPQGLHLRDCQSRAGTHVNGVAVQEHVLRDGDTIQVGPFSFQAHVPPEYTPIALPADPAAAQGERPPEVERQAEALRQKAWEYEQKAAQIEAAERGLAQARAAFEKEAAERAQRLEQSEQELHDRKRTLEQDVEAQWASWQKHQDEREREERRLGEERARLEAASSKFHERLARAEQQLVDRRAALKTEEEAFHQRGEAEQGRVRLDQEFLAGLVPLQHLHAELDGHRFLTGVGEG